MRLKYNLILSWIFSCVRLSIKQQSPPPKKKKNFFFLNKKNPIDWEFANCWNDRHKCRRMWFIPPGWGTICDGVNCYIRKCTMYYPWLWLLINIVVTSYWRWRDWFHSNLKNNCECALIIKDNRWYIYGCNNWHRHKSCPNLEEWPMYKQMYVMYI